MPSRSSGLQFAIVVSNLVEAIVSVKRISSFLDSDELQTDARDIILKENIQDGDDVLSIKNGEFFWSKDGTVPTLQDINLTVKKGDLIAVLGQVGAGKVGVPSGFPQHLRNTHLRVQLSRAAYCPPSLE